MDSYNNCNLSFIKLKLSSSVKATLHYIETGQSKKIDVLLLYKICEFFYKDFNYFIELQSVKNPSKNIKKSQVNLIHKPYNITNNLYEAIIEDVKELIYHVKQMNQEIIELKKKLKKNNKDTPKLQLSRCKNGVRFPFF